MNDVPLIKGVNINDINSSIIAIKKQLKAINETVGLIDIPDIDTSVFVKKSEVANVVESGNNNPVSSNAVFQPHVQCGTFGILGGAGQATSNTIDDLLNNELCGNGGKGGICGGSVYIETSTHNVPIGWYNFMYIPHKTGISGDNVNYGVLLLSSMIDTSDKIYVIKRVGVNYNANIYKSVNLLHGIETYTIDANTHIFLNWVKKGDVCSLNFSSDVPIPAGTYYIPRGSVPLAVLNTSAGGFQITWGTIAVGYGFLTTDPNGSFTVVITQQSAIEAYKTYVCAD